MTLYFYFLNRFEVSVDLCEVIELPKTYKPVDRFPKGYYNRFVKKSDVGKIVNIHKNVVIMTEKNDREAYKIFADRFKNEMNEIEDKIRTLLIRKQEIKDKIDALESF